MTIVIVTPQIKPIINGKVFWESDDPLNFSVTHKNLGSFFSSEQVKQMFSEEQVAH